MHNWRVIAFTLLSACLYWFATLQHHSTPQPQPEQAPDVVVAGPLQLLLLGGDRFLAANLGAVRATASLTTADAQNFSLRAHLEVSRLNPCHEDNYWVGNASLSWGGAPDDGLHLLAQAIHCRYWDEWPAFMYGFNHYFFRHDITEARKAVELAATRSSQNAAPFRTFATVLATKELDDARMALAMLQRERDKAKDPVLRAMLDKRVVRLQGLLSLRDAQTLFEQRFKRPLQRPEELLSSGLLESIPTDPLKLGYEFRDQTFHLRKLQIQ